MSGLIMLAVRNLGRRRTRTILTTLGVTLAIAFTVGLLSLSEGILATIQNEVGKFGVDIFIYKKGMETVPLPGMVTYSFPEEQIGQISGLENVRVMVPALETIVLGLKGPPLIVEGIPPESFHDFRPYAQLEQGRFLDDNDTYSILLGHGAAESGNLTLGITLDMMGKEFKVVGILAASGDMFDSVAFAPLDALQVTSGQEGKVNWAMVKLYDHSKAKQTAALIENVTQDLSAVTASEALTFANSLMGIARAVHLSVSSVSLLIGVLFVFATMLISVSERVREIGTLRAIGASKRYIFGLIVVESTLISVIGGILGCFGGYLISLAMNSLIESALDVTFIQTAVTPGLVAIGMSIALGIGVLSGLYPAWRASRLDIVEALRYE
jgi:putative ABC transport system permease protein